MKLRIRELREDNDLTQVQVAKYLHCDQSLYSKYERGERELPLALAAKLADLYRTSIDYIAYRTDEAGQICSAKPSPPVTERTSA